MLLKMNIERVEEAKKLVNSLVTPEGNPRPGVTETQIDEALAVLQKLKSTQDKYAEEFSKLAENQESLNKRVEDTREGLLLDIERFGIKPTPLLKKMYRM
jgi:chromosome segregation ATPase